MEEDYLLWLKYKQLNIQFQEICAEALKANCFQEKNSAIGNLIKFIDSRKFLLLNNKIFQLLALLEILNEKLKLILIKMKKKKDLLDFMETNFRKLLL